nr:MAG TPA: hypothetical protein [Caudoviricetes sp.]
MKLERKSVITLREGNILKENSFDTEKGCYTIRIILYSDNLYLHKMLNGKIVEVINLDQLRRAK